MVGVANANATVTVNALPAVRKGEYYRREVPLANQAGAVWQTLTAVAVLNNAGANNADVVTNQTGKAFLPQNPENFTYDEDGNLKSDGRWNYTWNGENRLVQLEALNTVPEGAKQKLTFQYDHFGRRVRKLVYSWTSDHWVLAMDRRFAYDGWNLIAELDASNAVVRTYLWGLDLSGSMQGAGGVGGLLAVQGGSSVQFVSHDGNGNVAALFNAADGTLTAQYEYGPFGELIRKSGSASGLNPFRFSTKYQDEETDFLYYGYRFYNASLGRWINRDPIEERGGANLSAFNGNDTINGIDVLGEYIQVCADSYFKKLGLTSDHYARNGDVYVARAGVEVDTRGSVEKEIIWRMMSTKRMFKAKNNSIEELKQHVKARMNIIKATAAAGWNFGKDSERVYNNAYWQGTLLVRWDKTHAEAINDMFSGNASLYQSGCHFAGLIVGLKGISDTIGSTEFSKLMQDAPSLDIDSRAQGSGLLRIHVVEKGGDEPTLKDWVPGDRGYVRGKGSGLAAGEWITNIGDGKFWGFGNGRDYDLIQTLPQWIKTVKGFSNGVGNEDGQRWFPGVGLER
jgi:RHS repeat-associated protein